MHCAAISPTLMTQSLPAVMMTCLSAWWARASTSLPLWATHWYTRCGCEAGRLRMSHTHRRPSNPAGSEALLHKKLWYDFKGAHQTLQAVRFCSTQALWYNLEGAHQRLQAARPCSTTGCGTTPKAPIKPCRQ